MKVCLAIVCVTLAAMTEACTIPESVEIYLHSGDAVRALSGFVTCSDVDASLESVRAEWRRANHTPSREECERAVAERIVDLKQRWAAEYHVGLDTIHRSVLGKLLWHYKLEAHAFEPVTVEDAGSDRPHYREFDADRERAVLDALVAE